MSVRNLFLVLILFIGSCDSKTFDNSDRILARVYDSYLYLSDIEGVVPQGADHIDSLSITRNYINNWVKNQLLLFQAEKNLTSEQMDFSRQLKEYRNSLVIYKYESELLRQNLDTLVQNAEIEQYYQENQENFELQENIVQLLYVKIEENSRMSAKIESLVWSDVEQHRDSLEYYCMRYASDYAILDHTWVTFNTLMDMMPLNIADDKAEDFLKGKKHLDFRGDGFIFYANLLNYRLAGDVSPLKMVEDNIRAVILNKRKKVLIRKMQQEIYDEAMDKNDFEFF